MACGLLRCIPTDQPPQAVLAGFVGALDLATLRPTTAWAAPAGPGTAGIQVGVPPPLCAAGCNHAVSSFHGAASIPSGEGLHAFHHGLDHGLHWLQFFGLGGAAQHALFVVGSAPWGVGASLRLSLPAQTVGCKATFYDTTSGAAVGAAVSVPAGGGTVPLPVASPSSSEIALVVQC